MSQFDFGTIDPSTKSGTALASDLNSWRTALHTMHKGGSRPAYAVAGTMWLDDTSTPWEVYIYDGADDILIGTVNSSTNAYSPTFTGNLTFTDTGNRITGDFSNATVANRVMFQTSTANSGSALGVITNGTAGVSRFEVFGTSDPTNGQYLRMNAQGGAMVSLESGYYGTPASGTYLPMTTYVGGFENTRQPITGGFTVTAPAGLGYGIGAGGTVTQATSKATAVTLNKPCGQITMNNAALNANTTVQFTFSNSLVTPSDIVLMAIVGGYVNSNAYNVWVGPGANSTVNVRNITAGSLSEALVLQYVVIKGVTS